MSQAEGLVCVGLNHRVTPVKIRERAAFSSSDVQNALSSLVSKHAVSEAAILSTCNRVELYAHGDLFRTKHSLFSFLHDYHELPKSALDEHLYHFDGSAALAQLFRVATSVDSMIVGEPQILGQVKQAFWQARDAGTLGPSLTKAFNQAFLAAKRVRRETEIGKNAVTVSFAAVELAKKIFGDLNGTKCVLVGAGETSEIAAMHFKKKGAKVAVCNRSLERAALLASKFQGSAHPLEQLTSLLKRADIALFSTSASKYIVDQKSINEIIRKRRYNPLFMIDISVPRNVEPAVNQTNGVYLYDMDDLAKVVASNFSNRQKEVLTAQSIIDQELKAFHLKSRERLIAPSIRRLELFAKRLVNEEIEKNTIHSKSNAAQISEKISSKLLHEAILELKQTFNKTYI